MAPDSMDVRTYKIAIVGQTGSYNAATNTYEPSERFRRTGTLIVEQGAPGSDFSVGLSSGSFVDYSTGALHVVSNSYVLRHNDFVGDGVWQARTQVARMTNSSNEIVATIDPTAAPAIVLNNFVVRSTPVELPKQILEGTITITTSGQSVSGKIALFGGSYIETGTGAYAGNIYEATFTT